MTFRHQLHVAMAPVVEQYISPSVAVGRLENRICCLVLLFLCSFALKFIHLGGILYLVRRLVSHTQALAHHALKIIIRLRELQPFTERLIFCRFRHQS